MNLQNYYYYFQSALTPRFCDELIKYGISQQEQLALTGGQTEKVNKGKPLDDKDIIDLKRKEIQILYGFQIDGYTKRSSHLYIKQID